QAHLPRQRLDRLDGEKVVAHVGAVRPPAEALLRADGEAGRCVAHEVLPSEDVLEVVGEPVTGGLVPVDAGGGLLLEPGSTEVSVSWAQRSLNPARKARTSSASRRSWEVSLAAT